MGAQLSGGTEHRYVMTANWHRTCDVTGIPPTDNTNTVPNKFIVKLPGVKQKGGPILPEDLQKGGHVACCHFTGPAIL